jgi:predicted nucleic acid-binding protein
MAAAASRSRSPVSSRLSALTSEAATSGRRVAIDHAMAEVDLVLHEPAWNGAENYRQLRRQGIKVRKTIDGIIATACIEANLPLLFSDRDFQPYVEHLGMEAA